VQPVAVKPKPIGDPDNYFPADYLSLDERLAIHRHNESLGFIWLDAIEKFVSPEDKIEEHECWISINGNLKWKKGVPRKVKNRKSNN